MKRKQEKPKSSYSRLWQTIIAAKLVLLAAVWFAMNGGITIGDLPLYAKGGDAKNNPENDDASKDEGKKSDDEEKADKKTSSEKEKKDSAVGDGKKSDKPRKSFLSNLLELPELNPDSMKKEEVGRYLDIAERKKRQIEDRLANLGRREDQLKGLESSIDEKLKKLDEERRYFAQTIQKEKDLKGERVEKLVALYSKMEPKKAAPVMEKLDKDLVVEMFKQLPQKQVTAILEVMSADKSVALSEYYGRIRSAKEYDILKEMNASLRKEFDDCKGMPKG
jgi:flagellar motility protein MotE (MotC chaperone)